jgi:uncharacterized membrane protein
MRNHSWHHACYKMCKKNFLEFISMCPRCTNIQSGHIMVQAILRAYMFHCLMLFNTLLFPLSVLGPYEQYSV